MFIKHTNLWAEEWILHHDVSSHITAILVKKFFGQKINTSVTTSTILACFGPSNYLMPLN
jgi:hypothetical protein